MQIYSSSFLNKWPFLSGVLVLKVQEQLIGKDNSLLTQPVTKTVPKNIQTLSEVNSLACQHSNNLSASDSCPIFKILSQFRLGKNDYQNYLFKRRKSKSLLLFRFWRIFHNRFLFLCFPFQTKTDNFSDILGFFAGRFSLFNTELQKAI